MGFNLALRFRLNSLKYLVSDSCICIRIGIVCKRAPKMGKGKELGEVIQKNENIAHNCFDWYYKNIVHNKYFV